jgi:hypothetical protein
MRKVKGNELQAYLFSFKLRSDGQLQVQCFSKKWHTYNRKPLKREFGKNK